MQVRGLGLPQQLLLRLLVPVLLSSLANRELRRLLREQLMDLLRGAP